PSYATGAFVTAAEFVQANLKAIGIETTIRPLDTAAFTQAMGTKNYQFAVNSYATGTPNSTLYDRHYTGGGQNNAKYADPAMDRMIDQQAVLVKDPEGRKKILMDIQRKLINDAAYIPLLVYESIFAAPAYIKDLYPPAGG